MPTRTETREAIKDANAARERERKAAKQKLRLSRDEKLREINDKAFAEKGRIWRWFRHEMRQINERFTKKGEQDVGSTTVGD